MSAAVTEEDRQPNFAVRYSHGQDQRTEGVAQRHHDPVLPESGKVPGSAENQSDRQERSPELVQAQLERSGLVRAAGDETDAQVQKAGPATLGPPATGKQC